MAAAKYKAEEAAKKGRQYKPHIGISE